MPSLPQNSTPTRGWPEWAFLLAFLLVMGPLMGAYLSNVRKVWDLNPILRSEVTKSYDQDFYMEAARGYVTGNPALARQRSRMPLYPWLISHLCDTSLDEVTQATRYMRFNVGLSIAALLAIGLIFRHFVGSVWALWLTGVTALHVFVFKAILIQPEVLFYLCSFAAFAGMLCLLVRATAPIWAMLFLGILAACSYLLKGTELPVVALFLAIYFVRLLWNAWVRRRYGEPVDSLWKGSGAAAVFVLGFLSVAGYHMFNSYRWYGSPSYDANSRYYLWADSSEEMFAMQRMDLAVGKPTLNHRAFSNKDVLPFLKKWLPDDARRHELEELSKQHEVVLEGEWDILPGFKNYWKSHSPTEALQRVWEGYYELWDHNHDHPDGYGPYMIVLTLGALTLGFWRWMRAGKAGRRLLLARYAWAALLAISTIGASLTLYAWWAAVSNRNRFFLSQYLPLVFVCVWVLRRSCGALGWREVGLTLLLFLGFKNKVLEPPFLWCLGGFVVLIGLFEAFFKPSTKGPGTGGWRWRIPGTPLILHADVLLWLVLWIWFFRDDLSLHHPRLLQ